MILGSCEEGRAGGEGAEEVCVQVCGAVVGTTLPDVIIIAKVVILRPLQQD